VKLRLRALAAKGLKNKGRTTNVGGKKLLQNLGETQSVALSAAPSGIGDKVRQIEDRNEARK